MLSPRVQPDAWSPARHSIPVCPLTVPEKAMVISIAKSFVQAVSHLEWPSLSLPCFHTGFKVHWNPPPQCKPSLWSSLGPETGLFKA